jgi:segregation and condensation protein B
MMQERNLQKEIEAVLFYKSEPVSLKDLCRIFSVEESVVNDSIKQLSESLTDRGITLVSNNGEYSLTTSKDVSDTIEMVAKDELNKDLSSASLEVLSIIAYKGSVTRKEIEYIRGVNSSFSLRALLLRGLITREASRLDERVFLYKPTTDLLLYLGIKSIEELPEWKTVNLEIKKADVEENKSEMNDE